MKLEFLAVGSPDCPLIRLYEFTQEEACHLRDIFCSLANGTRGTVALEKELMVVAVGGCRLMLKVGVRDRGIQANDSGVFECELTQLSWDDVAALMEPFCDSETQGYQWLTRAGRVSLLISHDSKW